MSGRYLINPDDIKRGKMLGRGAFGFVFRASMRTKLVSVNRMVYLKQGFMTDFRCTISNYIELVNLRCDNLAKIYLGHCRILFFGFRFFIGLHRCCSQDATAR